MLPAFPLIPAGMGLAIPAVTTTVLASVVRHCSSTASTVLDAERQAGGTLGVIVFGALVAAGTAGIITGPGQAALAAGVLAWSTGLEYWPGGKSVRRGLLERQM